MEEYAKEKDNIKPDCFFVRLTGALFILLGVLEIFVAIYIGVDASVEYACCDPEIAALRVVVLPYDNIFMKVAFVAVLAIVEICIGVGFLLFSGSAPVFGAVMSVLNIYGSLAAACYFLVPVHFIALLLCSYSYKQIGMIKKYRRSEAVRRARAQKKCEKEQQGGVSSMRCE